MLPDLDDLVWEEITPAQFDILLSESLRNISQQVAELRSLESEYLSLLVRIAIGKEHSMVIKYLFCETVGGLRIGLAEKPLVGF